MIYSIGSLSAYRAKGEERAGKKLEKEPVKSPRCPMRFASPIFSRVMRWLLWGSVNSNSSGFRGSSNISSWLL